MSQVGDQYKCRGGGKAETIGAEDACADAATDEKCILRGSYGRIGRTEAAG